MNAQKGDLVDHINGDKLDNRTQNLRFATFAQNSQNTKKKPAASGFLGVHYDGPYIKAGVKYRGKRRHLGMFPTLIDAAIAYDREVLRLYGPDARTNLKHFEEIVLALKRGTKKRNNI